MKDIDSDLRPQFIRRVGFPKNAVERNYEEFDLHSLIKEWGGEEGNADAVGADNTFESSAQSHANNYS